MRIPERSPRTHCLSKDFLIFTLGSIALLAILIGVLALPHTWAKLSNNVTMDRNSADFQARNETCSTWVGIPLEEGSENNTDIPCLQKLLEKCQPFDVALGYVLGSMRVSIKGLNSSSGDNCFLSLKHEIERGETNMTCTIPLAAMSTWTSWKRGDGIDAVDQISNYCVVQ